LDIQRKEGNKTRVKGRHRTKEEEEEEEEE